MAPKLPMPARRLIQLLRRADRRLFELALRWPSLSDEQIGRALAALDVQEPVAGPLVLGDGPTSPAVRAHIIAAAEERLRRVRAEQAQREASAWWRRRMTSADLRLPFASWTVFRRDAGGCWAPVGACAERTAADEVTRALSTAGVECVLVAWDEGGGGRLVPPRGSR